MSEELEVLITVTGRLETADIPYMITGSMAANYYTVPRMTRDIDIVVELSGPDVDRVIELFQDDFYIEREAVETALRERTMFHIIHNAFVIKVDIVIRKENEFRFEEFSRKKRISVEGHEMFIVAPEDLILSKLEWAKNTRSEVQLADVRNLLTGVEGLDRNYLTRWANRLGLESLYREVGG
jgi:hypothetical protein